MTKTTEFDSLEDAVETILRSDSEIVEEMPEGIAKSQVKKVRRIAEVSS